MTFQATPYLARLDRIIQPGQSLLVRGIIKGQKIEISLKTGQREQDDVAMRISLSPNEKRLRLSSTAFEEFFKVGELKYDQLVDIRIRAHTSHYEVYFNRKRLALFRHRISLNMVTYVFLTGDMALEMLSWEGNYYSVPYKGRIPGNFVHGRRLFTSGISNENAKIFKIILSADTDIALRLTVDFISKMIIRNSRLNNHWEHEETGGKMPIKKNRIFDIALYCELECIQIFIDNKRFCYFTHRVPAERINTVQIEGDLQLHALALEPNLLMNENDRNV